MSKKRTTTTVSAAAASSRLASLIKKVNGERLRVVITVGGEPAAVLLSPTDFDDMLEELDPVFQASLVEVAETGSASTVSLDGYLRQRRSASRQRR